MTPLLVAALLLAPTPAREPQTYDYVALANYNSGTSSSAVFFYRCGPADPSWRPLAPGQTTRAACPSGGRLLTYTPLSAVTCYRSDPDRQVRLAKGYAGPFGHRKTGTWSCLNAS